MLTFARVVLLSSSRDRLRVVTHRVPADESPVSVGIDCITTASCRTKRCARECERERACLKSNRDGAEGTPAQARRGSLASRTSPEVSGADRIPILQFLMALDDWRIGCSFVGRVGIGEASLGQRK